MYNSSTVAAAFVGAVQHAFDVNKRQRVIKFFSGYHKHVWLVKEFTVHLILKQAFSKQSLLSSICARTQRSVGCKINNGFRVCSQNVVLVFKIVLNIRQINFLAQLIKIKKILKSGIALWQRTLKKNICSALYLVPSYCTLKNISKCVIWRNINISYDQDT